MTTLQDLSTPRRRWLIARGLLRAAATTVVLVALYYVLPLDPRNDAFLILEVTFGFTVFVLASAWQIRAIVRSRYPGIRAVQALAVITSLFLLVFAATYFILSKDNPETFTETLSRSDAIYLTVTLFSTVGFGDIAPQEEAARLLVTGQMLLDLVILGLGIQVILGAVQRGRAAPEDSEPDG